MLDRYRHVSRLGSGGSSTVTLAEDTVLGRLVALKRMYTPDDVTARSRLRREAVIGASLSHPNLVSIYDVLSGTDGEEVIVMEYIEGETLAAKLKRGERLDVQRALAVLEGVASALDAIHARGIVHRDVKPGNVLLGADGSIKLADLGIASVPDRTQITTGDSILGTFRYMAPEQLDGTRATPAADIYALAAVAFEALSGEKPRREPNPVALAHAIATQPPPDLRAAWPEAPAAAADVLRRGMARDPSERPRSAGELTARLRTALEPPRTALVAAARRTPARDRRRAPVAVGSSPRRGRAAILAATLTLLAAGAVAGIVLANTRGSQARLASRNVNSSATSAPIHPATPSHRVHHSVAAKKVHRAAPMHKATPQTSPTTAQTSPATANAGSGASSSPAPPPVSPPPSPSPSQTANVAGGSPIAAVESFYHLAASHNFGAAWNLMDPAFRQQLQGYQGLEATMAAERAIIFNGADVVNQSPSSALVAVRTTSVQNSGSQNCSGTVNLLRAGSAAPGWVLDHIAISCV